MELACQPHKRTDRDDVHTTSTNDYNLTSTKTPITRWGEVDLSMMGMQAPLLSRATR